MKHHGDFIFGDPVTDEEHKPPALPEGFIVREAFLSIETKLSTDWYPYRVLTSTESDVILAIGLENSPIVNNFGSIAQQLRKESI